MKLCPSHDPNHVFGGLTRANSNYFFLFLFFRIEFFPFFFFFEKIHLTSKGLVGIAIINRSLKNYKRSNT
jgi:hypothetical protein